MAWPGISIQEEKKVNHDDDDDDERERRVTRFSFFLSSVIRVLWRLNSI